MNPSATQPITPSSAPGESLAGRKAVPVWLIVLLLVILYLGMVYFDLHGAWFNPEVYSPYRSAAELETFQPPPASGPNLLQGRKNFETVCGVCHGTEGVGKPGLAPPYVGSEWIPLEGLNGPITVNGQIWTEPSSMPAMGATLSDEDLANVLSYIRITWGKNASAITPEQVHAVRVETANHPLPWSPQELLALPEK